MMNVYTVDFTQSFEETRTVFAHSEEDAKTKLQDSSWSCGDLRFHKVSKVSDTTEGHREDYEGGASYKGN